MALEALEPLLAGGFIACFAFTRRTAQSRAITINYLLPADQNSAARCIEALQNAVAALGA